MSGYCVFDIETGPEEPAVVWGRTGMDALPPLPRPFDESEVKVGHLKDPAKIAEKVRISRGLHEQAEALAVLDHPAELMQAIDKAALDPMTGRVFAFDVLIVNESGALSIGIEDVTSMSESQLLKDRKSVV